MGGTNVFVATLRSTVVVYAAYFGLNVLEAVFTICHLQTATCPEITKVRVSKICPKANKHLFCVRTMTANRRRFGIRTGIFIPAAKSY